MKSVAKSALIFGVTGQDGSYMADRLLGLNYAVYGFVRPTRTLPRLDSRIRVIHGCLEDANSIFRAIDKSTPDEIYNFAAQSHVGVALDMPVSTVDVNATAVARLLEAVKLRAPSARVYQAITSDILVETETGIVDERSQTKTNSPYAAAKLAAWEICKQYRKNGLFVACALPFPHESERRTPSFLTRKVTKAAARISLGLQETLTLGTLDSSRDWGYAPDFVRAIHKMTTVPCPEDFVLGTGICHTIRDVLTVAFGEVELAWKDKIKLDSEFVRPHEHKDIRANFQKATTHLCWKPETDFNEMICRMVRHDLIEEKYTENSLHSSR